MRFIVFIGFICLVGALSFNAIAVDRTRCQPLERLVPVVKGLQSDALSRFTKQMDIIEARFLAAKEKKDKKQLQAYREKMMSVAQDLLTAHGYSTTRADIYGDGSEVLLVMPYGRKGSLHPLAKGLFENLDRVLLIFDPSEAFSLEQMNFRGTAGFDGVAVRLSVQGVRDLALGRRNEGTLHETLHAYLTYLFRTGVDSLFHGDVMSNDQRVMTEIGVKPYGMEMDLAEMAAYPYTAMILASELGARLRNPQATSAEIESIVNELKSALVVSQRISKQTLELVRRARKEIGGEGGLGKITVRRFGEGKSRLYEATIIAGNANFSIAVDVGEQAAVRGGELLSSELEAVHLQLKRKLELLEQLSEGLNTECEKVDIEKASPKDREALQRLIELASSLNGTARKYYRLAP